VFGVCLMLIRYILWAQNMSPKISRLVIALFLTGVPFVYTALTAELSETSFFASSLAGTIEDAAVSDFNEIPANKWIRLKTSGNPPAKVFHGAATIAPDRDEVFFFGADTHYADYDNGVFRLNLKSLKWHRDYEADSTADYILTPEGYTITKSGRPWAMHTFDCWDYDPVTKKVLLVGFPDHAYRIFTDFRNKGLFIKGRIKPATWFYDPDTSTWDLIKTNSPGLFAHALVWDPIGKQFIGHNGRETYHYDSSSKKWITYKAASVKGWHRKMVFDTSVGHVLTLGHNGGSDILYKYDATIHKWEVVETAGKALPANGAALAYDTYNQIMLYLANDYHNQYNNPSAKSVTFIYDSRTTNWKRLHVQSPELYGMNYLTQYDPSRRVILHFEKANNSNGRIAVWVFKYKD